MNRRQLLLGTLLAPLIKPVASMLPKKEYAQTIVGTTDPLTKHTNLYKIVDELSTGEVRTSYRWIEEDFYGGETWSKTQVHDMLATRKLRS